MEYRAGNHVTIPAARSSDRGTTEIYAKTTGTEEQAIAKMCQDGTAGIGSGGKMLTYNGTIVNDN